MASTSTGDKGINLPDVFLASVIRHIILNYLLGVGKTSTQENTCILHSHSSAIIPTIGIDFSTKQLEIDGKRIKLQVRKQKSTLNIN